MNDATSRAQHPSPTRVGDVLLILLAMVLFLFALQPREHAHGERRREGEVSVEVALGGSVGRAWQRFDAEARPDAVVSFESRARR